MDKEALARAIADKTGATIAKAHAMLDAARDITREALSSGEAVNLRGWMTITPKQIGERPGRNPKTGEQVIISARTRLTVKIHESYKV